jgi:hypothetical protein
MEFVTKYILNILRGLVNDELINNKQKVLFGLLGEVS